MLPADLEVFVSMDTHDPNEEDHERRLQNLNRVGRNRFNFGELKTRASKRHPDRIYLTFVANKEPVHLYVKCSLKKSDKEVHQEKQKMVDKFKSAQRESGKKIDLKGLSPKTV